jgi:hypothetical protein
MNIDEFWKRLQGYGVAVPQDVQRRVGLELNQERVLIRPPGTASSKLRVLEFGTGVPATYIARKLGITVQRVYQIRRDCTPK